jgi:hypothetical protein
VRNQRDTCIGQGDAGAGGFGRGRRLEAVASMLRQLAILVKTGTPVMEALPAPVEAKPKRARKPKVEADAPADVVADLEVAAKPKRTRASRATKTPGAEVA